MMLEIAAGVIIGLSVVGTFVLGAIIFLEGKSSADLGSEGMAKLGAFVAIVSFFAGVYIIIQSINA